MKKYFNLSEIKDIINTSLLIPKSFIKEINFSFVLYKQEKIFFKNVFRKDPETPHSESKGLPFSIFGEMPFDYLFFLEDLKTNNKNYNVFKFIISFGFEEIQMIVLYERGKYVLKYGNNISTRQFDEYNSLEELLTSYNSLFKKILYKTKDFNYKKYDIPEKLKSF